MGEANNICTDKTGTLTTSNMSVADAWFGAKLVWDVVDW